MLTVTNLKKRYGRTVALAGTSFEVGSNEIIGLIGRNGAGKTTLLSIIADLSGADSGNIELATDKLGKNAEKLVWQGESARFNSVIKISDLLNFYSWRKDFEPSISHRLLQEFEIDPRAKFNQLSLGLKKQAMFALSAGCQGKLLLLDEPFSGIDQLAAVVMAKFLVSELPEGSSCLIASHDLDRLEKICSRYLFMRRGKIVLDADSEQLKADFKRYTVTGSREPDQNQLMAAAQSQGYLLRSLKNGVWLVSSLADSNEAVIRQLFSKSDSTENSNSEDWRIVKAESLPLSEAFLEILCCLKEKEEEI